LASLGDGLSTLQQDLERSGLADRALIFGFSELGRRVAENGSAGTGHGAAGAAFAIGSRVKGGIYGDHPRLSDLVEGDLRYTVDFRQVYPTVLEDWFNVSASSIPGGTFDRLGFVI
jgi:uncharacterized protein (DUF1501 family)